MRCLYAVLGAVPQVIDVHSSLRPHQLVADPTAPLPVSKAAGLGQQAGGSTITVGISSPRGGGGCFWGRKKTGAVDRAAIDPVVHVGSQK